MLQSILYLPSQPTNYHICRAKQGALNLKPLGLASLTMGLDYLTIDDLHTWYTDVACLSIVRATNQIGKLYNEHFYSKVE